MGINVCYKATKPNRTDLTATAMKPYLTQKHTSLWVSRILGNGNGSGKRKRELPFAILLTIKPIALKSLSHCHV